MNKTDDLQTVTKAKGRPMLTWVGKKPLDRVEYYPAQEKEIYGDKSSKEFNKFFWGDNLQVLSHLLKDYRGEIDLIYIDPPFDSKADYVKTVKIKGERIEGEQQNILEEKQYTDIWENDEYLQFIYERLLLIRELLTDEGSVYLHCDHHKVHQLRCLLDEVFGEENFLNEIVWRRTYAGKTMTKNIAQNADYILWYSKTDKYNIYQTTTPLNKRDIEQFTKDDNNGRGKYGTVSLQKVSGPTPGTAYDYVDNLGRVWKCPAKGWRMTKDKLKALENQNRLYITDTTIREKYYLEERLKIGKQLDNIWVDVGNLNRKQSEILDYPTQKPEELLERIIKLTSKEGDLVMDCFCGSGTTMAVAQKLGRRWIGCDINIGAIQTSTKRLAQIIDEQMKGGQKLIKDDFNGLYAFKIYNVNDYDIFKNEVEAKDIVMDMYGVEPIKRSSFDGFLDNNFVKVMPLNRVLNKLDIKTVLKNIEDNIDSFTAKTTSKTGEATYQEGVIIICSGAELDTDDYIKKENKTGVKITIRDILNDKKNLIFKKKPEAKIEVKVKSGKLSVVIKEFYSPILMRKLELENEKMIDKKAQAKVEDFKQIIDSVAIDVDYDGKLFNAEIMDLPDKKEMIKAEYSYTYPKKGKNTVAIKIVDVLGEEYFETFTVEA